MTKEWKDGTTADADRIFSETKTVGFTVYQKLGEMNATVYTAYGEEGKGTITYTPATETAPASWSVENISNLPKYVFYEDSSTWLRASYYVVEDDMKGVSVTYTKGTKGNNEPTTVAENAIITNNDTERTVTITNTDTLVDLDILKVDSNGMTKPLPGATFTIEQIDETKTVLSVVEGTLVTGKTTGDNQVETGADGIVHFTGLKNGYYIVTETKLPDGYVQSGDGTFYIRVEVGAVSLVERDSSGQWKPSDGNDKLRHCDSHKVSCEQRTCKGEYPCQQRADHKGSAEPEPVDDISRRKTEDDEHDHVTGRQHVNGKSADAVVLSNDAGNRRKCQPHHLRGDDDRNRRYENDPSVCGNIFFFHKNHLCLL